MKVSAWGYRAIIPANGTACSAYALLSLNPVTLARASDHSLDSSKPRDKQGGWSSTLPLTDEGVPVTHSYAALRRIRIVRHGKLRPAHVIEL